MNHPSSIVRLPLYHEEKMLGSNGNTIQQKNRALILRMLRDNREMSRVEIASRTGLKKATVTIIISDLLETGIIESGGYLETEVGRKAQSLHIAHDRFYVIAVKFSHSHYSIGLFDFCSECLMLQRYTMPDGLFLEDVAELLANHLKPMIAVLGSKAMAIGVGYELVSLNMWNDASMSVANVREVFQDRMETLCGIPVLCNRNMFFSAYRWRHLNSNNLAMSTVLSISVNSSVQAFLQAANSYIILGKQQFAGSIGRIPVTVDNSKAALVLDDLLSTDAIVQQVIDARQQYPDSMLYQHSNIQVEHVIDAYYLCDPLARFVYNRALKQLGNLLSAFINLLNPDCIVLSGKLPYCKEALDAIYETATMNILPMTQVHINFYYPNTQSRQTNLDPVLSGISENISNQCIRNIMIDKL